jgi:succinoglycan biosynthesis protein ExoA
MHAMHQSPVDRDEAALPAAEASAQTLPEHPPVSIIVSVLNEERHVAESVRHALAQDYPGELELVVALGPSRDRTDSIVAGLVAADPRVRSVPNPSRTGATPAGLNAALAASRHPIVVRIDGHSLLPADYVRTAVETLRRTGADNVGGVMAAEGISRFEQAVARAMTSKLGVGNASFHTGGAEGEALTVYLGAFRRSALDRVGGYDEAFLRAQDWEMNLRIRQSGGLVWFQPSMRVAYRPRSTPRALARQYFHYGRWRRVVARHYPQTLSVRYLAAPVAVLGVLFGTVAAVVGFWPAAVLPLGYLGLILLGSIAPSRGLLLRARPLVPVVIVIMHMCWGIGFLTSPRKLAR